MGTTDEKRPDGTAPHTRVADALQAFRFEAGGPSYAEIASRVSRMRAARSESISAHSVARSTVYDVFRPERKRLDADLVADIILALGGSDLEAATWRRRCADENVANRVVAMPRAAAIPGAPTSPAAPVAPSAAPAVDSAQRPRAAAPIGARIRPLIILAALIGLSIVNVAGGQVVLWLELPLFLDMIGTAVAAILLGPWYGVVVAVLTQVLGALAHDTPIGLPYTLVGIAGALLWGYGVRSWGLGRTALRFFALSIMVAIACTTVSAPITVLLYGGFSEHAAADTLTERMLLMGDTLGTAVFSANLVTSLLDKLIAGFIALAAGASLARRFSSALPALGRTRLLTDFERLRARRAHARALVI